MSALDAHVRQRTVIALHAVSLVVAGVFLLWAARDQWFDSDEWNFLVRRRLVGSDDHLGVWDPHNRHWTTLAVLAYRLLFTLFGVRTYVPYVVMVVVCHLLVAHLLWRLMLRFGVDDVFATAAAGLFALAGAGWENVGNGFQVTIVGSLGAGLGAFLVARRRALSWPRVIAVWALLVTSLMLSGVGVSIVAIVVVAVLFRTGLRGAVVVGVLPTTAYGLWHVAYGRSAPAGAGEQSLWPALQDTPAFVWRGLTSAVDVETGLAGIGAVLLVLLGLWAVRNADTADDGWRDAVLLALGAPLFLGFTALGRSGLGSDAGAASRYAYVTIALVTPLAALGADRVLARNPLRAAVLVVAGALLVLVSVSTVARNADATGLREQEQKRRVLASAGLVRDGDELLEGVPVPVYMPDLDVEGIRELDSDGALPSLADVSDEDVLTARARLQLAMADTAPSDSDIRNGATLTDVFGASVEPGDGVGCTLVRPSSDHPEVRLRFGDAGAVALRSERGGEVIVHLVDPSSGVVGRPRVFVVPSDDPQLLSVSHPDLDLRLELVASGGTTICGVRAAASS